MSVWNSIGSGGICSKLKSWPESVATLKVKCVWREILMLNCLLADSHANKAGPLIMRSSNITRASFISFVLAFSL